MLRIQKAQANNLVLTLKEKTTVAPVFYFLVLFSNQDHDEKVVSLLTNLSTDTERYDEFIVTENDVEDLPNAIVSLDPTSYDYTVWQSPTSDYADKISIVETGKCLVIGDETVVSTYTEKPTEYTYNG